VLYELLYTGNSGNYVCGQSYTGNWHSPVWSLYEDVYSGYNKKINISGYVYPGIKITSNNGNQIFYKMFSNKTLINEDIYISEGELIKIEGVPKCESYKVEPTNYWSLDVTLNITPEYKNLNINYTKNYLSFSGYGNNAYNRVNGVSELKSNLIDVKSNYIVLYDNSLNKIYGVGANFYNVISDKSLYPKIKNGNYYNSGKLLKLSAGDDYHCLGILDNYELTGWGNNNYQQATGYNSYTGKVFDVAAGYEYSLAIINSGIVTGWGNNETGQYKYPYLKTGAIKISAGYQHSIALYKDNTIISTGSNEYGQIPNIDFQFTQIKDIFCGPYNTFIVYDSGSYQNKLMGFGANDFNQSTGGNYLTGVKKVSSSSLHTVALLDNGEVTGWGNDQCGNIDDITNITGVNDVYAGKQYTLLCFNKNVFQIPEKLIFTIDNEYVNNTGISLKNLKVTTPLPKIYINDDQYYLSGVQSSVSFPIDSDLHRYIYGIKASGSEIYEKDLYIDNFKLSEGGKKINFIGNNNWGDLSSDDIDYLQNKNFINGSEYIYDPALLCNNNMSNSGISYFYINNSQDILYSDKNLHNISFQLSELDVESSGYEKIIAPQEAWISYDVSTGMNSKNVFAYSLEVADFIKNKGKVLVEDGLNINIYNPIIGILPRSEYGIFDYTRTYERVCLATGPCDSEESDPKDNKICWTGKDITGQSYIDFVATTIAKYQSETNNQNSQQKSNLFFSQSGVNVLFESWTGVIVFGDFVSGDKINFDIYNFGNYQYNQQYQSYFSAPPPYQKPSGFSIVYGLDFESPEELVSLVNDKFKITEPSKLWYPYSCPTGYGETGIFIDLNVNDYLATGSLLNPYEYYGTGIDSGLYNQMSGRLILIKSNHFHSGGYNLSINLSSIRESIAPKYKDAVEYLLPRHIELLGSNNGNDWDRIDVRSGINWEGLTPITGLIMPDDLEEISGNYEIEESFDIEELLNKLDVEFPSGSMQDLFSITQTKYKKPSNKYCPATPLVTNITAVWPTGWPAHFTGKNHPCNIKDSDEEDKCGCPDPQASNYQEDRQCDCLDCCKYPEKNKELLEKSGVPFSFYKTGWVVDGKWQGIGNNQLDYINYDYYKLYFSGFNNNIDYRNGIIPTNSFYIKEINLFSSELSNNPILTGDPICIIGADYTVDVMGYVPVTITGILSTEILDYHSGIRRFDNAPVYGLISGQKSGDLVLFNKQSGRLTSDFATGFFSGEFISTGLITTGVTDWFYDTGTTKISFSKTFSGSLVSGSGQINENYIRLKPSFVNEQLAYGGFFSNIFNISITTGVVFTGEAIVEVVSQNLTGYYNYTGTITGYANSGYYQLISGVNINLTYPIQSDYIAGGITGYNNASAWLNYGSPMEFDWLSINNKTISYSSDSGSYVAPDFYSNSGVLLDTINSNPSVFLCSASVQQGKILLNSLLSGYNGNSIGLTFGKGENIGINYPNFETVSLTGGQDLYKKIYATGSYTGILNKVLYSSGYYTSNNATGNISGPINVYQGTRDFTGVWNLTTGDFFSGYVNFAQNNLINYDTYLNTIGGPNFGQFPKTIDFILSYNNVLNTESTDVVKLTISGVNTNSGIVRFISGVNS